MAEGKAERINRKLRNYDLLVEALRESRNELRRLSTLLDIVAHDRTGIYPDITDKIIKQGREALKAAGEEV